MASYLVFLPHPIFIFIFYKERIHSILKPSSPARVHMNDAPVIQLKLNHYSREFLVHFSPQSEMTLGQQATAVEKPRVVTVNN